MRCLPAAALVPVVLLLSLATTACTRYLTVDRLPQAYYQTAFPTQDVSGPVEEAFRAVDTSSSSTSREASAVQVAQASLRVTLLTNQHAIQFPDTIVEYAELAKEGGPAPGRRPIHRISIKKDQYNLVVDRSTLRPFEVLVGDPLADLALIGTVYSTDAERPVPFRPPGAGGRLRAALLGVLRLRAGASRWLSRRDQGRRE